MCVFVCACVCIYICLPVYCMYISKPDYVCLGLRLLYACVYVLSMCVCVCVCVCVLDAFCSLVNKACVYLCVYTCVCVRVQT